MSTPEHAGDLPKHRTGKSPHRMPSAADAAAATLRDEILNGQHFSGDQLRESQLSLQLGVSRNTIREAYRKLEVEGLLVHKPHQGVYVSTFDTGRIRELYAFRRTAECGAIYSLTEDQARSLGARLTEITRDDSTSPGERNNRFHLEIVAASESPELLATAKSIQAQLRLCFLSYPQTDELHARFASHHPTIAEALAGGDINRAADVLRLYLSESFDAIVEGINA